MFYRAANLLLLLTIAPLAAKAQSADSLHLLWRNESITGVTAHAFSHSGNILALANDHEIKFWDLKEGEFVRTISIPYHRYVQMAFTTNDSEIIGLAETVTPLLKSREDRVDGGIGWGWTILQIDVGSGKCSDTQTTIPNRSMLALSPDGTCIAVITDSGDLSLHQAISFRQIAHIQLVGNTSARWGNEVWFGANGRVIVALFHSQVSIRDPHTLEERAIIQRKSWKGAMASYSEVQSVIGEGIFPGMGDTIMYDAITGRPSILQPRNLPKERKSENPSPRETILLGGGNYIAARYNLETWTRPIDYGTRTGRDTIIIYSRAHPEGEWGMEISPSMSILDVFPDNETLLVGDRTSLMSINARTHEIKHLTHDLSNPIGFLENGSYVTHDDAGLAALDSKTGSIIWSTPSVSSNNNILLSPDGTLMAQAIPHGLVHYYEMDGRERNIQTNLADENYLYSYFDNAILVGSPNHVSMLYSAPDFISCKPEAALNTYFRYLPATQNSVLIYSCGDTAKLYDYAHDRVTQTFVGGLNYGVALTAISHDRKWVLTVEPFRNAKLWRVSDGQLTMAFRLDGRGNPSFVDFSPNDHYLLFSNDTALMVRDLTTGETRSLLRAEMNSRILLSRDGSKIAVSDWNEGISMYELPAKYRFADAPIDPKTVYLPLRFYLPKDARDAIDTDGKPYNPPRTDVILELRYADGKLLKRILDGAFHKNKWHLWEFEMTNYPKGTYIMHTEIGGVVKDEKMEVR